MEEKTARALKWMTTIFAAHNIPYQISGGFAARVYGSPRPLNDIDFDIPDALFPDIVQEVAPYITFGPARFTDEKWDCELITLNYFGQEIDICGADSCRITSKDGTHTLLLSTNLASAVEHTVVGIRVRVIPPHALIAYKRELNGDHQQVDIDATMAFVEIRV